MRQLSPITTGPSTRASGVDLGALAEPDVLADAEAVDVDLDPAVEDVLVRPEVRLERADVLPVALAHVAVERRSLSRTAGNTSLEKSTTSPSGMKSKTAGSST